MSKTKAVWSAGQVILQNDGRVCNNTKELLHSELFASVVRRFINHLRKHDSPLLVILKDYDREEGENYLISLLAALGEHQLETALERIPEARGLAAKPRLLHQFVEELYDYWRRFDRFLVCYSETGTVGGGHDARPYTTFNNTTEQLTHLVRAAYRDIAENITGDHPRIYRQVAAGAQVGLITAPKEWPVPEGGIYESLSQVPFIRQILIQPPLILDPPMNKRSGQFEKVDRNPIQGIEFPSDEWLCYPAQVGPLVVFIYFHHKFMGLGCSLANLFELATDDQIKNGPDAIYAFGVPAENMESFGTFPTVFYEDEESDLLVAAVPGGDEFGYFGYLKKMVLTLHNVVVMKRFGRMPFHGAMVRIVLKNAADANIVLIGDTGAGKSESLEAFRVLGEEHIREMRIIADDMGSLEIDPQGRVRGYGTEIGAFVRLDDLQPGFGYNQIDRAIIMSPHKINARAVMPVTTMYEVLRGYRVDYILYANNYEEPGDGKPIIELFRDVETALNVFREGAAMSKGTTTSQGMTRSYFANIFGPPQYLELHETLARRHFEACFESGVMVGQIRTRLAIPGYETKGPELAARALFDLISSRQGGYLPREVPSQGGSASQGGSV